MPKNWRFDSLLRKRLISLRRTSGLKRSYFSDLAHPARVARSLL